MPFEMNIIWACVYVVTGFAILIKGADLLVDGAVALARKLGVSPLVIGLTIVAMGTSAPEVASSVALALRNMGDSAIGNVYGSNIANLALIGGLCAIIRPITVKPSVLIREMPMMLIVALLLWPVLAIDSQINRVESAALLFVFLGLLIFIILTAKKEGAGQSDIAVSIDNVKIKEKTLLKSIIFIIFGLVGLAGGAKIAVIGADYTGTYLGLSDGVIGLTIVAIGTSLPELVTCLIAALKGHDDISIGNLVGSNIFNTLLVVGAAGITHPFAVSSRFTGTDYWIMIVISAVFLTMSIAKKCIGRFYGAILLSAYIGYMLYILIYTRTV